jgi:CBS domain-containing protein
MSLRYSVIEVFTSEAARYQHKPVAEAIVQFVSGLKIAARCIVARGTGGCYENGQIATSRIEVLSFNMPLKIEIILPTPELEKVLPTIERIVTDGIVVVEDMEIRSHKTSKRLIPNALRVRDVMTASPTSIAADTSAADIARVLMSAPFHGVPVVDRERRPVGIVTQSDLITRADMPLRLGMLEQFGEKKVDTLLSGLATRTAGEIMSQKIVTISEDDFLVTAVDKMLANRVKRMPVVDSAGKLAGMLSRIDVFHTISRESPDWIGMRKHNVQVGEIRCVADIMRTDVVSVTPETSLERVVEAIDTSDVQRVVVIDAAGKLLGIVSDGDLLEAFSEHHAQLLDILLSKIPFLDSARRHRELLERARARTAGEIMKTGLVTVLMDAPLDEAIKTMADKKIKLLPVIDSHGTFKGLVTRDSLLRAGHAGVVGP